MRRDALSTVRGTAPRLAAAHTAVGWPGPEEELAVRVVLRSRALTRGHRLAAKVRRQLAGEPVRFSEREFAYLQAPEPGAVKKLRQFARAADLEVAGVSRSRHDVLLVGAAERVEDAFGVELELVDTAAGARLSHRGCIKLPRRLHRSIVGVLGLDRIPRHTHHAGLDRPAVAKAYSPRTIAEHYRFPGLSGAGQRIAILSFGGGFHRDDVDQYFQRVLRIRPPNVRVVEVGAAVNAPVERSRLAKFVKRVNDPGVTVASLQDRYGEELRLLMATFEVTLDVQIAGAAAPGADIDVIFADGSAAGFYEAIYTAIGLGPERSKAASVVSISWGQSEQQWGSHVDAIDQAIRAAALKGITVVCSSGDRGSYVDPDTSRAQVKYPASSAYALTVGGTGLTAPPLQAGTREVVWNRKAMGIRGASGGGVSGRWPLPAYQRRVTEVAATQRWVEWRAARRKSGRGIPDVAAVADPVGGYRILLGGRKTVGAGTSAGAPLWAGLIACLQEGLESRLGWLTPLLYRSEFRDAFRDVTQGHNRLKRKDAGFSAREGWDCCTGHGTPLGDVLLERLRALYDAPRARRER